MNAHAYTYLPLDGRIDGEYSKSSSGWLVISSMVGFGIWDSGGIGTGDGN
jgi:NO-binding membrane sensor protein with MHYT domain